MLNNNGTAAHRLLSDLPLSIFEKLTSTPRAVHHHHHDDDDAASSRLLRQQILSKLSAEVNNDKPTHPAALSPPPSSSSSITVRQLLKISELGLLRILDPLLTIVECRTFLKRVHNVCAAQSHSALKQLVTNTCTMRNGNNNRQYYNSYKIPTGLLSIDNYLHGGFAPGTITEVVGRAGVGKTHLAASSSSLLSATSITTTGGDVSTRSSCGAGGSIFIDTENKLSLDRLNEIAINQCKKQEASSSSTNNNYYSSNSSSSIISSRMNPVNFAQHVLENVTIRSLLSTKELLETLDELELEITERNNEADGSGGRQRLPVRLLVIDSIAAPIRRDFDMMMTSSSLSSSSSIAAQRAAAIFQIARKLKELASNFNLAVVVINQVGAGGGVGSNMSSSNQHQRNDTLDIRDGEFTASLGTAWQYCVSTRIILEHDDDPHMQGCNHHRDTRTATIAKSLLSRRAKVEFEVTDEGLCEVFS